MTSLVIGTVLAMLGLAFVLWPIFAAELGGPVVARSNSRARAAAQQVGDDPIVALREIEFDRATGKLSDNDYATLKTEYTQMAVTRMRSAEAPVEGALPISGEDQAERAIRIAAERLKGCATCGPRPESDALFCSNCGRHLAAACISCGERIPEDDAVYCSSCGISLAA